MMPAPQLPKSRDTGVPMAVHQLHNLAHVELNAIDLAWDTVARFAHLRLPPQLYADFAHVADDEARHLGWCLQRLHELGHAYGDLPAHDLLWEGAAASRGDVTARLAVVPMSQVRTHCTRVLRCTLVTVCPSCQARMSRGWHVAARMH